MLMLSHAVLAQWNGAREPFSRRNDSTEGSYRFPVSPATSAIAVNISEIRAYNKTPGSREAERGKLGVNSSTKHEARV
jgi:hypothetical protein